MSTRSLPAPRLARSVAVLGLLAVVGCASPRRPIVIDSEPPGAAVVVDGEDTGHVTPCTIRLDEGSDEVALVLPGHVTVRRALGTAERTRLVTYDESNIGYHTWRFPLWLGWEDALFPAKQDDGIVPRRIFARLVREGEL